MNHQTTVIINEQAVQTLSDILPSNGPVKMLIIGKTPAPCSVQKGHYFQGKQGKVFWRHLREHNLLPTPPDKYEDQILLEHGYAITDVVKAPRSYGSEPTDNEYKEGWQRISALISELRPHVLLFVYKGTLDKILRLTYGRKAKAKYGFNDELEDLFRCKVFAFPMSPQCKREVTYKAMVELRTILEQVQLNEAT